MSLVSKKESWMGSDEDARRCRSPIAVAEGVVQEVGRKLTKASKINIFMRRKVTVGIRIVKRDPGIL